MKLKIKKELYIVVVIITAILLSTLTIQAATLASTLLTDTENFFTRVLTSITGFKLPYESADTSSDIHIIFRTLLRGPGSSPLIMSASHEGNNLRDNTSRGDVASVPEPLTLLLLGTGLMGLALYRRLKNK